MGYPHNQANRAKPHILFLVLHKLNASRRCLIWHLMLLLLSSKHTNRPFFGGSGPWPEEMYTPQLMRFSTLLCRPVRMHQDHETDRAKKTHRSRWSAAIPFHAGLDEGERVLPDAFGHPSGASFRQRRSLVVRHSIQVKFAWGVATCVLLRVHDIG